MISSISLHPVGRALVLFLLWAGVSGPSLAQKQDYLTDEEIEQLREAQEPPERVKLLVELLSDRLEKARALKDPSAVKTKPVEAKTEKKKNSARKNEPASEVAPKKNPEPPPTKTFAEWMDEYLQCLEEVSNNLENFSGVPMDPKAYLKSLKRLDEALQENSHWIGQIEAKLERSEKKVVEEVTEVLGDLIDDVTAAMERAEEQINLLKEAEKARRSRR